MSNSLAPLSVPHGGGEAIPPPRARRARGTGGIGPEVVE